RDFKEIIIGYFLKVMEIENLDGFLKLTKPIDWITGNETVPINNKVVVKESKKESHLLMETLRSKLLIAKVCQLKVGFLHANIYEPSIPTMMKFSGKPEVSEDMKMIPIENHRVKCMSIGFFVEKDTPIVWRGPMVFSLNYFSDLLTGALIVSTPRDIALIDARRGGYMFCKVEFPATSINIYILGVIENMSCFKCPHCGEPSYIFGSGGARRTVDEMDMEFLGEV
ncbi:hypothetical protein GIB67_010784, partial [Kingdonia uniflora]